MFLPTLVLLFSYTTFYYYSKYNDLVKVYRLDKFSKLMLMDDDDDEEDVLAYIPPPHRNLNINRLLI